jgi:hypothetical protein
MTIKNIDRYFFVFSSKFYRFSLARKMTKITRGTCTSPNGLPASTEITGAKPAEL